MASSSVEISPLQEVMLEFRAGKMSLEGTRVVPDNRKGLVRIGRGEEGLVHFQWLDRTQNIVEDDQIIFPDEAVFEKEPQSDGDLQICNWVNCYINRPIDMVGEDEAEASVPLHMSEMSEDTVEDDLSSRAGILVDQNVAGELAGEVTSSAGPVQLADLQRILRSIQPPGTIEDPDGGLGLGDILKPDLLSPLIETLSLEQRLASYLPEGSSSPGSIMEILQSAPFRQQVDSFSYVLRTGQIDLSQFGIDPSKYGSIFLSEYPIAYTDKLTVPSFLEALEDSVSKELGGSDLRRDENKDAKPQRGADPMDES